MTLTEVIDGLQLQIESLKDMQKYNIGKIKHENFRRIERTIYELVEARNKLIIVAFELEHGE